MDGLVGRDCWVGGEEVAVGVGVELGRGAGGEADFLGGLGGRGGPAGGGLGRLGGVRVGRLLLRGYPRDDVGGDAGGVLYVGADEERCRHGADGDAAVVGIGRGCRARGVGGAGAALLVPEDGVVADRHGGWMDMAVKAVFVEGRSGQLRGLSAWRRGLEKTAWRRGNWSREEGRWAW